MKVQKLRKWGNEMKILLVCNDKWHKGQVAIEGFGTLAKGNYEIDIITDAGDLSRNMLDQYQVIVLCKSREDVEEDNEYWGNIETQKTIIDYVEKGGGVLAIHSGLVGGSNTGALEDLLGCRFISHPEQSLVTTAPLKPHFITKGIDVFIEKDEHYIIEVIQDDIEVLFASYSPPQGEKSKYETEPYFNSPAILCASGYVRKVGEGRVCGLTPGHNMEVWLNPTYQNILINAIKWCGGHNI